MNPTPVSRRNDIYAEKLRKNEYRTVVGFDPGLRLSIGGVVIQLRMPETPTKNLALEYQKMPIENIDLGLVQEEDENEASCSSTDKLVKKCSSNQIHQPPRQTC